MTDAKHSPTLNYKLPLRAIEMPGCMKYELLDAEDQRVAILPDWQKDLAELIVRSVNSLPELLEVLKEAQKYIKRVSNNTIGTDNDYADFDLLDVVDKALSDAEVKP